MVTADNYDVYLGLVDKLPKMEQTPAVRDNNWPEYFTFMGNF